MVGGLRSGLLVYGIGAGLLLLLVNRLSGGAVITGAAEMAAGAPVDAFIGASKGLLGVPDTRTKESKTRCQQALDAGNDWEASWYCSASTWAGGVFDGK